MNGKSNSKVAELMNTISWLSYDNNSDGEGFLKLSNSTSMFGKKLDKFIFREAASTLVTHQRFATSGAKSEEYAHPFETENLIVFHNGVLDCSTGVHSDTYVFANLLQTNFDANEGNIVKAINETHKTVSGSFSIVIYIKNTKQLLYYKNNCAQFYFARFNNYLVGSTNRNNVEYACKYLKYTKKRIYSPLDHKLYDVLNSFKVIADLDIQESVITKYSYPMDDDLDSRIEFDDFRSSPYSFPSYTPKRTQYPQQTLADQYWSQKEAEIEAAEQMDEEKARKLGINLFF